MPPSAWTPADSFDPNYNQDLDSQPKTRAGLRNRSNLCRLIGGASPGPGNIFLTDSSYGVLETEAYGTIALTRTNGTLGYLSANLSVSPGTAQGGVNYSYSGSVPTYLTAWRLYDYLSAAPADALTRCFSDGLFGLSASPTDIYGSIFFDYTADRVVVSVIRQDPGPDLSASILLANPSCADQFYLGGETVPLSGALGPASAPFLIVNNNYSPGVFGFSATNYSVNENVGLALIDVTRTNGTYGAVSLHYATTTNGTAVPSVDYWPTNGNLYFAAGVTNLTFAVPIINNTNIQSQDRIVGLNLDYLSSGSYAVTNANLVIINDNYPIGFVNFTQPSYSTNESAGAIVLTLNRTGGSRGNISVLCATTNTGSARPGVNYLNVSTNLSWNSGDSSPRYVVVPLLDNGLVGPNTTFQVNLSDPVAYGTNAPTMLIGSPPSLPTSPSSMTTNTAPLSSAPRLTTSTKSAVTPPSPSSAPAAPPKPSLPISLPPTPPPSPPVPRPFAITPPPTAPSPSPRAKSPPALPCPSIMTVSSTPPTSSSPSAWPTLPGRRRPRFPQHRRRQYHRRPEPSMPRPVPLTLTLLLQASMAMSSPSPFRPMAKSWLPATSLPPMARPEATSPASMPTRPSTLPSSTTCSGANAAIYQLLIQTDGSIVVGGAFTTFNGVDHYHFARVLTDGTIDSSFSPGSGADGNVFALAEVFPPGGTNRSLLVGGSFTHVNGVSLSGLARLNNDGGVDPTFAPVLNSGSTDLRTGRLSYQRAPRRPNPHRRRFHRRQWHRPQRHRPP